MENFGGVGIDIETAKAEDEDQYKKKMSGIPGTQEESSTNIELPLLVATCRWAS